MARPREGNKTSLRLYTKDLQVILYTTWPYSLASLYQTLGRVCDNACYWWSWRTESES
jgi:hypothetical protein